MVRRVVWVLWGTWVAVAASSLTGAEVHVGDAIRDAMQDRDYDRAMAAIDEEIAKPDAPKDYLTYLKGRALHYQQQYDKAAAVFESVQQQFPDSPWARRARLARAMALARMRGYQQAEELLRSEAEFLLSEDRKDDVADIYLAFASEFFEPPDKQKEPDYQKALEFFNEALEVGPRRDKRAHILLRMGRCHQHLQQWDQAIEKYQTYLSDYADQQELIEARYRLGETQLARGDASAARRTWQDLMRLHGGEPSPRLAEAAYHLADTYGLPHPSTREDLDLGVAALRAFVTRYPGHELASTAMLRMAQAYQVANRHEDAVRILGELLTDQRYQDRSEIPEARFLLGLCFQQQRLFDKAIATWKDFLSKHPSHDKWTHAQRAIVNTEYLRADDKRLEKKYAEARELWLSFLAQYPLDERAPTIWLALGKMNHAQDNWMAAIDDWRHLVSKYPQTEPASSAQLLIAITWEENLRDFDKAMEAYKQLTWGSQQSLAERALKRLTDKAFSIHTDGVFRSDQQPYITLHSRNIETLDVRCYRIDLETYFRKMHLARGIEQLDISLIDPDEMFEFQVPEYEPYKRSVSRIPLTSAGSADDPRGGVVVVSVTSDKQEATTMVLQSDLDIIAKSSRDEVFVFAQNMRTGEPWGGVRLLISDGADIFAEVETGEDGVLQGSYPELQGSNDVRVFAIAGDHTASNVIGLEGLSPAQGLTPIGALYTERAVYRPGQTVHFRGIVRSIANDSFAVEAGKKYELTVMDARSRPVWQEQVELNEFGTFHTHFTLPRSSALGTYRVQITDKQQQSFESVFEVQQYQLENIQIVVDTPRRIYYRGEEIEGTIRLQYYFGAPLAGANVVYSLADQRTHVGKTNERGELEFKLPTTEFRETQVLSLVVEVPDRNLQIDESFVLAAQGFGLEVSTARPVFLSGETFEITVRAVDAEGKPVARDVTVKVFEQTQVRGELGEVERFADAYQTDEKDGRVRLTQTLDRGGSYIIRAEGTDRFGNPVSGQHTIRISDEKDDVRLRILAEQHTYRAGDKPTVRIHWRDEPTLALVTYQGARVLKYELVRLQQGNNELPVSMDASLAPNFDLDVAVMTNPKDFEADKSEEPEEDGGKQPARYRLPGRLHTTSSPFVVERDLHIELTRSGDAADDEEGTVQPGSQVTFQVRTTNPQGQPVAAEVSLAMIEQALIDRAGSVGVDLRSLFRGITRISSLRTTSSVMFAYNADTKDIDENLLAEADRRAIEADESAALDLDGEAIDALFGAQDAMSFHGGGIGGMAHASMPNLPGGPQSMMSHGNAMQMAQSGELLHPQQQQSATGRFDVPLTLFESLGDHTGTAAADTWSAATQQQRLGKLEVDPQRRSVEYTQRIAPGNDSRSWHRAIHDVGQRAKSGSMAVQWDTGVWQYVNTARLTERDVEALANQLAPAGGTLIASLESSETGYWNPSVVTNDEGVATVSFDLPNHSTAWRVEAQGISRDALAGEATAHIVARHDLTGELKLPLAFTDGDRAVLMATIHNRTVKEGTIQVTLTCQIGERTQRQTKTLAAADSHASGSTELQFPLEIQLPEGADHTSDTEAQLTLTIEAGELSHTVGYVVPIVPYGLPVFATASGTSTGDTTAWLALPDGLPVRAPRLQVVVGPSVEQSMLDVLFGVRTYCEMLHMQLASVTDTVSSDLMAAIAVQEMFQDTRVAHSPWTATIDDRLRQSISSLVASQNDDGGWSWTHEGTSHRFASARCVWALGLAKERGFVVADDTMARAIQYLQAQLTAASVEDYEAKAVLLHALSTVEHGDFPLANRLFRNRPSLSVAAILHLAMALHEMDRDPMAAELLDGLAERDLDNLAPRRGNALSPSPWNHAPTELRALYAVALQQVRPADRKIETLVQWLLEHRAGHRWSPDKATGPATLAAARWFSKSRFVNERYRLVVWVNDRQVGELEITEASHTASLEVPSEAIREGARQEVRFEMTGRGRFAYQCVMEAFVPADQLKSSTNAWRARRYYLAAPLQRDGREVRRGFDVVEGSYSSFRNTITQLPVGERAHVELHVWRDGLTASTQDDDLEYLVVTEPLPAGAAVVESSIRGGFERYEISPGAITFFVGSRRSISTLSYDIHGYLPGEYRASPSVVRDAYRLDQWHVVEPGSLQVLAANEKSSDPYRLTPRELLELGSWHFQRKEYEQAATHLDSLLKDWRLKPEFYQQATTMLLDCRLAIGPPAAVVQHFEVIKEKWPELTIPYDKILKIGAAYHDMGEYERCYLIFRATIESSFLTESRVAGFLQSQGQVVRSIEYMRELLRQYPPEPYVAAATFDLAQQIYSLAPQAATHPELREKKITRVDLLRRSARDIDDFLTAYPNDPAADQASFSRATALLELEQFTAAIEQCIAAIERYPDSADLDSFWYTRGYCHFALDQHEEALEVCQKVVEMRRPDAGSGQMVPTAHHYHAIYILGQIYHSLGKAAEAIQKYEQVDEQFADAAEAIRYFTRRDINLPEVLHVVPNGTTPTALNARAAAPADGGAEERDDSPDNADPVIKLPLEFRNVAECFIQVYRIDLLKFGLLERDLQGIADINLAGIRPHFETHITLGDGKDYQDREHEIPLPLKEEGAYLVVCRGDNLHASGMVLVSSLKLEVQEEVSSGRVRATIRDVRSDRYISDVDIKVIGSANDQFVSGKSDLRGVFVADNIRGVATVIAKAEDGQYAFFRGEQALGPEPVPADGKSQSGVAPDPAEAASESSAAQAPDVLLKGLIERNSAIQTDNMLRQQEQYFNEESGVPVEAVK